jgi:uncharacterized protein YodC (DUF2158 family)
MSFTVGTTVKLKSGGPTMTIQAIADDSVTCVWFDKGKLRKSKFLADMLEDSDRVGELLKRIEEAKKEEERPSKPIAGPTEPD